MLNVGDQPPDFTLTDQHGHPVRLGSLRGQAVIVYFYPKNNTPACTAEACAFRDAFEQFAQSGVTVIGISSDSARSHAAFAQRHQLPFHLLSDPGGEVRRRWEVPRTLGLLPGRVTYVLDSHGVIRRIINSQLRPERHIREALEEIRGQPKPDHIAPLSAAGRPTA